MSEGPPNDAPVVLLVDDDRDLVATLEIGFRRAGYITRTAHTGVDGIKAAHEEPPPDLIILDVMLPDIPGTELFGILREALPVMPMMFLTGMGAEIDRVLGLELGATDYVTKPFSVRELVLRVRAILGRSRRD